VFLGARPPFTTRIKAVSMAAMLPLVSQAPRPYNRPFDSFGVNLAGVWPTLPTVSMCGASKICWRVAPAGLNRMNRLGRRGRTFCHSAASPWRTASSIKNSASRISPPLVSRSGRNAGFTLGMAINSRRSFFADGLAMFVGARLYECRSILSMITVFAGEKPAPAEERESVSARRERMISPEHLG